LRQKAAIPGSPSAAVNDGTGQTEFGRQRFNPIEPLFGLRLLGGAVAMQRDQAADQPKGAETPVAMFDEQLLVE
jgi:hypothetical protein